MVRDVEAGVVEADVGAEIPGGERGLVGGIAAEEHDGGGGLGVALGGGEVSAAGECGGEGGVVGGAMVVDVVGVEDGARELLEEVGLFIGEAVGANDADGGAAAGVA